MKLFTDYQLAIIKFCAAECERQGSGELSVAGMVAAWQYAAERFDVVQDITEEDIDVMAKLIEPEKNRNGYRHVPVHFGDFNILPWEAVPRQVCVLLTATRDMSPRDFYLEYEGIHPHKDGNGRLGAILFNVLNGTLYCPVTPPPFQMRAIVVAGVRTSAS